MSLRFSLYAPLNISLILFAGSDTTASTIAAALYALAAHPDVQERLRTELKEARARVEHTEAGEEELSYEDLMGLPWLDAVCRETLRL